MTEIFQPDPQLRGQPGVYVILHPATCQRYVGSTGNCYVRPQQHLADLRNNRHHNAHLQAAYNEVPEIDFLFYPSETREAAYAQEQEFLDAYADDAVLFNISASAKGASIEKTVSDETRRKIREARARQVITPESREKAAAKMRGRARSLEVLEKIAQVKQENPAGSPVVASGVTYPTLQLAANALGLSYQTVRYRILSSSEQFTEWYSL